MAILIDPAKKTITEVAFDGTLEQAYKLTDCNMIEMVHLHNGDVMLVDEEGLFKAKQNRFAIGMNVIVNKTLVIGSARFWKKEPKLSLEDCKEIVQFEQD